MNQPAASPTEAASAPAGSSAPAARSPADQRVIDDVRTLIADHSDKMIGQLRDTFNKIVAEVTPDIAERMRALAEASDRIGAQSATKGLELADALIDELADFTDAAAVVSATPHSANPLVRGGSKSSLRQDLESVVAPPKARHWSEAFL